MNGSTWQQNLDDFKRTAFFLGAIVFGGLVMVCVQLEIDRTIGILISFASIACGAVLGFLFGIPPVPKDESANSNNSATQAHVKKLPVNTNLESISDWLTKILVGAGLVQLAEVPVLLKSLASVVKPSSDTNKNVEVVVISIVLAFFILGFFIGYLMTRLFLAGAFERANAGASVEEQVVKSVADLQDHAVKPDSSNADMTLTEESRRPPGLAVKSVIWIDDDLQTSSLIREKLKGLNIALTEVNLATALVSLRNKQFDRCIFRWKDIGNSDAFLNIFRLIQNEKLSPPPIVFCDPEVRGSYEAQAIAVGVASITASEVDLLEALQLDGW